MNNLTNQLLAGILTVVVVCAILLGILTFKVNGFIENEAYKIPYALFEILKTTQSTNTILWQKLR